MAHVEHQAEEGFSPSPVLHLPLLVSLYGALGNCSTEHFPFSQPLLSHSQLCALGDSGPGMLGGDEVPLLTCILSLLRLPQSLHWTPEDSGAVHFHRHHHQALWAMGLECWAGTGHLPHLTTFLATAAMLSTLCSGRFWGCAHSLPPPPSYLHLAPGDLGAGMPGMDGTPPSPVLFLCCRCHALCTVLWMILGLECWEGTEHLSSPVPFPLSYYHTHHTVFWMNLEY